MGGTSACYADPCDVNVERSCCSQYDCWEQSKCWRSDCHKHPCREGQTWCSILKGADEKDIKSNLDLKLDLPMGPCTHIPGLKEAHALRELKKMMNKLNELYMNSRNKSSAA